MSFSKQKGNFHRNISVNWGHVFRNRIHNQCSRNLWFKTKTIADSNQQKLTQNRNQTVQMASKAFITSTITVSFNFYATITVFLFITNKIRSCLTSSLFLMIYSIWKRLGALSNLFIFILQHRCFIRPLSVSLK